MPYKPTDGAARGELSLLKLSRGVTEEDEVKSTVSAIFRVKPFAKDWKRVWEKVEAPHYGKSPLKKSTMLNGLTIGLF